jgi:hypothetical protein
MEAGKEAPTVPPLGLRIAVQLNAAVYFPGDALYCRIDVRNAAARASAAASAEQQPIAWVALQLHGICSVEPARVAMRELPAVSSVFLPPTVRDKPSSVGKHGAMAATALPNLADFGPNTFCFLSTPLSIVACDVAVGHSKQVGYSSCRLSHQRQVMFFVALPLDLPPSYKGLAVRYQYLLTVAAQKSRYPAMVSRLPVRVLAPAAALRPLPMPAAVRPFTLC